MGYMRLIWQRRVDPKDIRVSPRPVWKCKVCEFYNKRPSCPPFVAYWKESKEWLNSYREAMLLKFEVSMSEFEDDKREVLLYLLKREAELFKEYHYVFALFPGSCNLCEKCEFEVKGVCPYFKKVRPSIDALGIEITSIVDLNFAESVLYGLIMLD